MFKTIILGLDGSPEAQRALPYAIEFAERDGGRIVAVHVRELLIGRAGGQPLVANEDEVVAEVREQIAEAKGRGVDIGLQVVTSTAGGPAHILAAAARKERADVIVVGTRGHGTVAGLLLGSVTHRLLHISPCPVFAVPATATEAVDTAADEAAAAVS
jgi:nucleotide-binding universal stress UspA family protein